MQNQTDMDLEPAGAVDESKNERFVRLANYRLAAAVKRIRMLSPLGTSNYEYTLDEAKFIIAALDKEIQKVEDALIGAEPVDDIPQLGSPNGGSEL